jgi:hypothetical protein
VFRIKVLVVLLAIVVGALVERNVPKWEAMSAGSSALPASAKYVAALSIALWIGAVLVSVEVPAFIPCI